MTFCSCGFLVDKLEQMLGSYAPQKDGSPYTKNFDSEESPSGLLARSGTYSVKSRIIDDDGEIYAGMSNAIRMSSCCADIPTTQRLWMGFQTRERVVDLYLSAYYFIINHANEGCLVSSCLPVFLYATLLYDSSLSQTQQPPLGEADSYYTQSHLFNYKGLLIFYDWHVLVVYRRWRRMQKAARIRVDCSECKYETRTCIWIWKWSGSGW